MMIFSFILAIAGVAYAEIAGNGVSVIEMSRVLPANANVPVLEAFMSYSIEFSSFPDFAGRQLLA
jgi:hypothetical protein